MRKQPNRKPKTSRRPAAPPSPPQVVGGFVTCLGFNTMAAAFEEWERRYRENPDAFWDAAHRMAEPPRTYGELCAYYFESIVREIQNRGRA